jgi:radical SAM superfamily enzyme YgiQ (UPF0313 family)
MKHSVHLIQAPLFWVKTPPLSLIYLKTYLANKGVRVNVTDLNQEIFKLMKPPLSRWLTLDEDFENTVFAIIFKNYPGLFTKLLQSLKDTDVIAFSLLKRNTPFSLSLAGYLKQHLPDKKIIFGGPQTLFLDKTNRLDKTNTWVIGEGEKSIYEALLTDTPATYRFQEIENLDTLDFYNLEPFKIKNYSPTIPLLSSRGCSYRCNFCSERLLYKRFRHHSPGYIIKQIKLLKKKYNSNNFVFLDSMINYKDQWLEQLCSLLIKEKCNIKWEAQMRIKEGFNLELARLMKKSGCYNLFIGLESASDEVLKAMNKGFDKKTAYIFFKTLYKAGLHFEISLIFGFPGETDKNFKETVNFIVKNKTYIPKIAQINPYIDYLNCSDEKIYPSDDGKKRTNFFLNIIEKEHIKHTKSFINNLIYPCRV